VSAWIELRTRGCPEEPPVSVRIAGHRAYCRDKDIRELVRWLLRWIEPQPGYLPNADGAAAREIIREIRRNYRSLRVRFVRSDYPPPDPNAVYDGRVF
jgi:hypothetical protein